MLERTADFLNALGQAQDIDAIWAGLRRFAASYGLEQVMLGATRMDPTQRTLVPVDYRTDLPADQLRIICRADSTATIRCSGRPSRQAGPCPLTSTRIATCRCPSR